MPAPAFVRMTARFVVSASRSISAQARCSFTSGDCHVHEVGTTGSRRVLERYGEPRHRECDRGARDDVGIRRSARVAARGADVLRDSNLNGQRSRIALPSWPPDAAIPQVARPRSRRVAEPNRRRAHLIREENPGDGATPRMDRAVSSRGACRTVASRAARSRRELAVRVARDARAPARATRSHPAERRCACARGTRGRAPTIAPSPRR